MLLYSPQLSTIDYSAPFLSFVEPRGDVTKSGPLHRRICDLLQTWSLYICAASECNHGVAEPFTTGAQRHHIAPPFCTSIALIRRGERENKHNENNLQKTKEQNNLTKPLQFSKKIPPAAPAPRSNHNQRLDPITPNPAPPSFHHTNPHSNFNPLLSGTDHAAHRSLAPRKAHACMPHAAPCWRSSCWR